MDLFGGSELVGGNCRHSKTGSRANSVYRRRIVPTQKKSTPVFVIVVMKEAVEDSDRISIDAD